MIPRSVLEHVGGYNEKLFVAIDYDLWVRIACHYQLANLSQALVIQRLHGTNFFSKISHWKRYVTDSSIRFRAWRSFKRPLWELFFVYNPSKLVRSLLWPYYVAINAFFGKRILG